MTEALTTRVYYEDTDAGGVVYHASYLKFFERCRTEWLRGLGFNQSDLIEQKRVVFVVSKMDIHFKKPARLDDELVVWVKLEKTGGASLTVTQSIIRNDELLVNAQVKLACVQIETFQPCAIPKQILESLHP